jgi:hypothetical protein
MSFLMEQAGGQAFTGKQRVCFSFPFSDPNPQLKNLDARAITFA